VLEQVSVIMQSQSEDVGLVEDFIIPLPALTAANSPGIVYVSFTRENPELYAIASFQCNLKFTSKELDPSTGVPEEEGYEDEYQVEEVELSAGGDYILPSYASFGSEWERMKSAPSATETFALSAMETLKGELSILPDAFQFLQCYLISQLPANRSLKCSTWNRLVDQKFLHRLLYIHSNCRA
jgi:coatomer protein complex subunit gamma